MVCGLEGGEVFHGFDLAVEGTNHVLGDVGVGGESGVPVVGHEQPIGSSQRFEHGLGLATGEEMFTEGELVVGVAGFLSGGSEEDLMEATFEFVVVGGVGASGRCRQLVVDTASEMNPAGLEGEGPEVVVTRLGEAHVGGTLPRGQRPRPVRDIPLL